MYHLQLYSLLLPELSCSEVFVTEAISEDGGGSGDREACWTVTLSFERLQEFGCIAPACTWSLLVFMYGQDCCV